MNFGFDEVDFFFGFVGNVLMIIVFIIRVWLFVKDVVWINFSFVLLGLVGGRLFRVEFLMVIVRLGGF